MSVKEKKNNGGFSLVELIVVIAISVVLIGAATYPFARSWVLR